MLEWVLPVLLFALGFLPVAYFLVNARLSRRRNLARRVPAAASTEVTIVVPVHAEPADSFRVTLRSLVRQGTRVIVVGDGCVEPYRSLAREEGAEFVALRPHGGKKRALAAGLSEVRTPYVLFVDGDTLLPEQAVQTLSSYFEPEVGGVGANLYVRDPGTVAADSAEFFERSREVVLRAMSSRGNVLYLDGACMMFRTELIRPFVLSEEFQNLKVLGRPSRLGDDWLLTDHVLDRGYRTVRAYDVAAYTAPPNGFGDLARRYVRWARSSWIRFGRYLKGDGPRDPGLFYRLELVATYALPLVSLSLLLARLPLYLHPVSLFFGRFEMWAAHGFSSAQVAVRPASWEHAFFTAQTIAGLVGTGSFVGAVAQRLPHHKRLRTLACGALGSGLLFLTMIYGLVTFWRAPAWGGAPNEQVRPATTSVRSVLRESTQR